MKHRGDYVWGLVGGLLAVAACFPNETALEGGKYATRLEECNRQSATLCESIKCENEWRGRAGRFPREVPAYCRTINSETTVTIVRDAGDDQ